MPTKEEQNVETQRIYSSTQKLGDGKEAAVNQAIGPDCDNRRHLSNLRTSTLLSQERLPISQISVNVM